MKTSFICITVLCNIFFYTAARAQKTPILKSETIKVWGNCETCKKRIENAAKSAGATTAMWNEDSQLLDLSYDAGKTSGKKIQEKIAASGHDTQDETANINRYDALPGCCKYRRKDQAGNL